MDFDFIYKLKTGKFWWLDVLLYLVLAFLISSVISYFILVSKTSSQKRYISEIENRIAETGTEQQLRVEDIVFKYEDRINKFYELFKNHKNPSNILAFIEHYTIPDVWFNEITVDSNSFEIRLKGYSKDMVFLSQQMDIFKKDANTEDIKLLRAQASERGGIRFELGFSFKDDLITYY